MKTLILLGFCSLMYRTPAMHGYQPERRRNDGPGRDLDVLPLMFYR